MFPKQTSRLNCEWGFDTPPEGVDLQRLYSELDDASVNYKPIYMTELEARAPITYELYLAWLKERRLKK